MLGSITKARIRPAHAQDAEHLARVFAESWGEAYRGVIPHLHLQSMIRRRNADWWRAALRNGETMLALEVSDQIGGYATFGPSRTRGAQAAEIYELYLAPTYQGLGLGELLFEGCRAQLDERRLEGLLVWVLAANSQARSFYWRRGGRPVARAQDRIGGARIEKVAYGWM